MKQLIDEINSELDDRTSDEFRFTYEFRSCVKVLLKALAEATWKKVIITYYRNGAKEIREYYSRNNRAVAYLNDLDNDDLLGVSSLCDIIKIRHGKIKKFLEENPEDYKDITEVHFTFLWINKHRIWKDKTQDRSSTYGYIFRNEMFDKRILENKK